MKWSSEHIKRVYFLGIGGIGMSALARFFIAEGKTVSGYDRTPSPLTESLQNEGMAVHYTDSPELIPSDYHSTDETLVIYTPAIPGDLRELAFLKSKGHILRKRSEILGKLSEEKKTIAVAGTHGKTTVSTMISVLLSSTPHGCNAFLGGISKNLNSNFIYNPESEWMVAEADEYDRSFLKLHPYASVITAIDPDHLDIYGTSDEMQLTYRQFADRNNPDGFILIKKDIPLDIKGLNTRIYTYSLHAGADYHADKIRLTEGKYIFNLKGPAGFVIEDISLEHPGILNVENAVAACTMAYLSGVKPGDIPSLMGAFSGIQRRFDVQVRKNDIIYIDDYGHHPGEIEATISSIRELYPGKKLTGIFQPHLYTRTRDFAEGFADSLSLLDELILLDIYPARELPIPGVTSEMILRQVKLEKKILCSKEDLLKEIERRKPEILITMGAGDIDRFVEPIKKLLS